MTAAVKKSKITKKELFRAYNKWYWLCEVSHCYDRLQSLSFCASIQNTLRKLYPMMRSIRRHCFAICNSSIRREL